MHRFLKEKCQGLIRHYLAKQTDLPYLTEEQLQFNMDHLNQLPQKTLEFKTPYSVFCIP